MKPATCLSDKLLSSGGREYKGIHCVGTQVSYYIVKIYKIYKDTYRYNNVGRDSSVVIATR